MKRSNLRRLLCGLLAGLLVTLSGCPAPPVSDAGNTDSAGTEQAVTGITVYSEPAFRASLQQVFSHISLQNPGLLVSWTSSRQSADVVITDQLAPGEWENFRVLSPEQLSVEPIQALVLRDDRGVIGIPLFVRMQTYWYDALLYSQSGSSVPRSLVAWQGSSLKGTYPAVYDASDMDTLFWSTVAPLYLSAGGERESLSTGALQAQPLEAALEKLLQLQQQGLLVQSQAAAQSFTASQTMFWAAGVDSVAQVFDHMSNLSQIGCAPTLLYQSSEDAQCVVRADVVAVRQSADRAATEQFLKLLFTTDILTTLSTDAKMPVACRISYAYGVVQSLPQVCYTALSSPSLQITYVCSSWEQDRQTNMEDTLLAMMNGTLTAGEAAAQLVK